MGFEFCDLPNVIVFSGKQQLNKEDIILQSEGRFHLADRGGDEGLFGISLRNQSTADAKNYTLEIEHKLNQIGSFLKANLMEKMKFE